MSYVRTFLLPVLWIMGICTYSNSIAITAVWELSFIKQPSADNSGEAGRQRSSAVHEITVFFAMLLTWTEVNSHRSVVFFLLFLFFLLIVLQRSRTHLALTERNKKNLQGHRGLFCFSVMLRWQEHTPPFEKQQWSSFHM